MAILKVEAGVTRVRHGPSSFRMRPEGASAKTVQLSPARAGEAKTCTARTAQARRRKVMRPARRGLDDRPGEVAEEVPDPVEEIGDGLIEAKGKEEDGGRDDGEDGPRVNVRLVVRNVIVVVVAHADLKVKGEGKRVKGKGEWD
jgi:hypothetical protein